ncbi:MAG: CinA family protein [Planctomycetales bacterium]
MSITLNSQAQIVADLLQQRRARLVLAESCTSGLVAVTLATVPGISEWLCGSAVTYREATKQQWLNVSASDLKQFTSTSDSVARQMAIGVLNHTPEANLAGSVTGHLGPGAPDGFDGVIFVGVANRQEDGTIHCNVERHQLQQQERQDRKQEAANIVLSSLASFLA